MSMVENSPPPSFHEINPARQPLAGPSMQFPLLNQVIGEAWLSMLLP